MGAGAVVRGTLAERNHKKRRGVGRTGEYIRVQNLPRRSLDLSKVPDLTPIWFKKDAKCRGCDLCRADAPRFRPIQSAALLEAEAAGGLLGLVGVGHGKELITFLLPDALGAERAVILTKPRLRDQALNHDLPRYSRHFRIDRDRFTIVAYSELSSEKGAELLERLRPDWIIANEAHCLRHKSSARTRRFLRYMKAHPDTGFCALSGTLANGSIEDFAHLSELALRVGSPLPQGYHELKDWSLALDVEGDPEERPIAPGKLLLLCGEEVYNEEFKALPHDDQVRLSFAQKGFEDVQRTVARRVFRRRLVETRGVVATAESSVDCSLNLIARVQKLPDTVVDALAHLRKLWKIEDEELSDAKDVARVAKQMACGFYYRWVWPGGEKDLEWLQARSAWIKFVREQTQRSTLDTPLQVERAVSRGELPREAWDTWAAVKERYIPHPPIETVWLSDFLVRDVGAWLAERTERDRGIVWYQSLALSEAFKRAGYVVYESGDDAVLTASQPGICVSLSYKEGLNLQDRYARARVLEGPANGGAWEQLLGRLHRQGQLADEVEYEVDLQDDSQIGALASAMEDARFVQEGGGGGQRQKLLLATRVGVDELIEELRDG